MFREFIFAITLIVIFSVGIGILFIRTILEMIELVIFSNKEDEKVPDVK